MSDEFENGELADQSGYPQHRHRSDYPGVSGEFENGEYADQPGYPQHRQRSSLSLSVR